MKLQQKNFKKELDRIDLVRIFMYNQKQKVMLKNIVDFVKVSVVGGTMLFLVMFTYLHILEHFGV